MRVKDVARADLGAKSQERYSRFNGAPAAAIGIFQSPGANAVDVAAHVRKVMDELKQRFPDDLEYQVFWDSTVFVTSTIDEVIHTLVIAFVLVAIVVFLFLGKLRTTLIPLVAVPVSIIGTFAVMLLIGYSANTVSLLALVLAIGIVVDDAIVVIENVERVIEENPDLSIPEATKKAMARDHRADHRHHPGAAVGVRAGRLHPRHQRPAVPPVRGGGVDRHADLGAQCADAQPGPVRGAAEARRPSAARTASARMQRVLGAIDWLRDGYVAIVRRLVRLAVFGVVAVAVCGAAAYGVFRIAPQGFLPSEDQGAFFVAMRLPEGASLNRTADLVEQVEDIIRPIPGVQGVVSVVGLNFIDYVVSSNSAFFVVRLKPYEQRTDRSQRSTPSSPACGPSSPRSRAPSSFPSTCRRSSGSAARAASSTCCRPCRASRRPISPPSRAAMIVAANQQPELAGVFTTFAADTPQVCLDIDRDKAQVLGVKVSDIFIALQASLGGYYVNDFNLFGRTWQVNIEVGGPLPRRRSTTSIASMSATPPAPWCRSARWPRPGWCRGRRS